MDSLMSNSPSELAELKRLLVQFMSGGPEDITREAAHRIEGLIASTLPEDDELQEFAESLAQYRPEGGDYLYSYKEMRPLAQDALDLVRTRIS